MINTGISISTAAGRAWERVKDRQGKTAKEKGSVKKNDGGVEWQKKLERV